MENKAIKVKLKDLKVKKRVLEELTIFWTDVAGRTASIDYLTQNGYDVSEYGVNVQYKPTANETERYTVGVRTVTKKGKGKHEKKSSS